MRGKEFPPFVFRSLERSHLLCSSAGMSEHEVICASLGVLFCFAVAVEIGSFRANAEAECGRKQSEMQLRIIKYNNCGSMRPNQMHHQMHLKE